MLSVMTKLHLIIALRSFSSLLLPLRYHYTGASAAPASRYRFSRRFTVDREFSPGGPGPCVPLTAATQPSRSAELTKEIEEDVGDGGCRKGQPQATMEAGQFVLSVAENAQVEAEAIPVEEKCDDEKEAPLSRSATNVQGDDLKTEDERVFSDIATAVCDVIGRNSEWEKILFSRLPLLRHERHLFDPSCVRRLLRSQPFVEHKNELPLRYFLWMSGQESFSPDQTDSTALFHAFVDAEAWNAAVSVIRSTKCEIQSSAVEPFLLVLCKKRAFDEVLEVVSVVKDKFGIVPSIPTWNSALWGSLRVGKIDVVWRLYNIMIGYGACGNVFTVDCLIEVFCKEKRLQEGCGFLRQIAKAGLVPNVGTFNKLVREFCGEGDFRKVSGVLQMMIAIGQPPNLSTYQPIIHALCVRRKVDEAFQIFDGLKRMGHAPDAILYSTIINGLCKIRRMADVQQLWQEMAVLGIQPNRYTYSITVDGHFKAGNSSEAQNLYKEMIEKGHRENTVSCNTLIAGLCQDGRTSEALDVFTEMTKKSIRHDVITYNTLIRGLCSEGKTVEARQFFRKLLETCLQPSEKSYIHLIRSLSKEGNLHEAEELFSDMERRGLKASNILHECMISAFCDVNDVDQGMLWFWKMIDSNLQPSEVIFNEFISRLNLANRVDDVFLVLNIMLEFGRTLSGWSCSSLIRRLCRMNCDIAANRLAEIITLA